MRKLIIVGLALMLLAPTLDARRKKSKAGKVSDQVFVDKTYNFSLEIDPDWKYKIGDEEDNFRLVLTQKNYETPPKYMNASEYTKVPRIVIYADTCGMGAMQVLDSLLSETYSSDRKKDVLKEFESINPSLIEEGTELDPTVTRARRPLEIGGEPAALWQGKAEYRKNVQTSASAIGGTRVYGAYGAGIVAAKKGSTLVLLHVMSEWDYFEDIMSEALSMISTLQWSTDKPQKEKEEG
ncbi:MAG: hypothetical protein AB1744_10110 [Candidatus Zixiibacteriota bacterium]